MDLVDLVNIIQFVIALIFIAFAGLVVRQMWKSDLGGLIAEPDQSGKASMSRFQLLLFTFVITGIFLSLSLETGTFVEIPNGVLGLLGISGASFVISKGISKNSTKKPQKSDKLSAKDDKG